MFFNNLFKLVQSKKRVYLDYASSTPVDKLMHKTFPAIPQAVELANPYALHQEGVEAKKVLKNSRHIVAEILGVHEDEIIFTSGATESDNLAIQGVIDQWHLEGVDWSETAIFVSELEHSAILKTAQAYQHKGVFLKILSQDEGLINLKDIQIPDNIKKILISVLYVNNEIGTVQPIKEIAKRVRFLRKNNPEIEIIFHTDATQAATHFSLNVSHLGVDLMTLGSTKLYTTKGVGMLFKRRSVKIQPLMQGGGQEQGLRPGTEDVKNIFYFAHALQYAQKIQTQENQRIENLQNYFERAIQERIPQAIITAQNSRRTPHISHVAIEGIDSELLVLEMDAEGIAVSTKSACKNEDDRDSDIIQNLYGRGWGVLRFSFGRATSRADLDRAVKTLVRVLYKYKILD